MTHVGRARKYDEALLWETHEALHASLAAAGFDSEKKYGRRVIPGDELGGSGFADLESGVFPVVKEEECSNHAAPTFPIGAAVHGDDHRDQASMAGSGPSAGPSSVHTLDTTRQLSGRTGEFAELRTGGRPKYADWRGPLVRERAAATIAIRAAIAERYRLRARELRSRARERGFSPAEIAQRRRLAGLVPGAPLTERQLRQHAVGAWHRARAKNEIAVEQVCMGCQNEKTMVIHCGQCGSVREAPVRCRRHFFCVGCRAKIGNEKRAKLAKAVRVVVGLAKKRNLFDFYRRRDVGGYWSLKLFTLTAPHAARHGVIDRTNLHRRAIVIFDRKLKAHCKDLDPVNADLVHWSRSREWEPCKADGTSRSKRTGKLLPPCTPTGACKGGHPHAHYMFFGPKIEHALAAAWWLDALVAVGYDPGDSKGHSNFDIKPVRDEGAVNEVIKYIFKDIDGKGKPIDGWTFALAYSALQGQRTTQCSAGFMKLAKVEKKCADCGGTKCFHTRMVDGVREDIRPGLSKARPSVEPTQRAVTVG